MTKNKFLTPIEIMSVECPRCGAEVGHRCLDARESTSIYVSRIKGWHQERKDAYRKSQKGR